MQIPAAEPLGNSSYQHEHRAAWPLVPFDAFDDVARQTLIDSFVEFMRSIPEDAWLQVKEAAVTAEWTRLSTDVGLVPADSEA